jgi:hypothetical protein
MTYQQIRNEINITRRVPPLEQKLLAQLEQLSWLYMHPLTHDVIYFSIEIDNWIALFFPRSLSYNQITEISPRVFQGLSALKSL